MFWGNQWTNAIYKLLSGSGQHTEDLSRGFVDDYVSQRNVLGCIVFGLDPVGISYTGSSP